MPQERNQFINILGNPNIVRLNPGEVAVTGRVTAARLFTYAAAQTVNNDGNDSAWLGEVFYVGDIWRDISSEPHFIHSCDNDAQNAASWQLYGVPAIFGSIHVHDNSTAQSIPTGTGYTKITAFTDNGPQKI